METATLTYTFAHEFMRFLNSVFPYDIVKKIMQRIKVTYYTPFPFHGSFFDTRRDESYAVLVFTSNDRWDAVKLGISKEEAFSYLDPTLPVFTSAFVDIHRFNRYFNKYKTRNGVRITVNARPIDWTSRTFYDRSPRIVRKSDWNFFHIGYGRLAVFRHVIRYKQDGHVCYRNSAFKRLIFSAMRFTSDFADLSEWRSKR